MGIKYKMAEVTWGSPHLSYLVKRNIFCSDSHISSKVKDKDHCMKTISEIRSKFYEVKATSMYFSMIVKQELKQS
jgi:hypothetical protein